MTARCRNLLPVHEKHINSLFPMTGALDMIPRTFRKAGIAKAGIF